MNKIFRPLFVLPVLIASSAFAQLPTDRMSAGAMYYAGDTVKSIRLGLYAIVPVGWKAVLPRETEVVVLVPDDDSSSSTIYAVLNENMTLAQQKINLEK